MQLRLRVKFRPAGAAREGRLTGGIPKSVELHMKTIKPIDVELGAPREALSEPGYFKPRRPPPGANAKLIERFNERNAEFDALADDVAKLQSKGKYKVINGVVKGPNGERIAGDYDLYEFTTPDGKRLNPGDKVYDAAYERLKGETIDVQHPTHVNFEPANDFERGIKAEIIDRHTTTEPLYEFREDGEIWEVFAE
jgi:hypothetical protein